MSQPINIEHSHEYSDDAVQENLVYSSASSCPVCNAFSSLKQHEKVQSAIERAQDTIENNPTLSAAYKKAQPALERIHDAVSHITLEQVYAAAGLLYGLNGLKQGLATRKYIAQGDTKRAKRYALLTGLTALCAGLWAVDAYLDRVIKEREALDAYYDELDDDYYDDSTADSYVDDYYDLANGERFESTDNDNEIVDEDTTADSTDNPWIVDAYGDADDSAENTEK